MSTEAPRESLLEPGEGEAVPVPAASTPIAPPPGSASESATQVTPAEPSNAPAETPAAPALQPTDAPPQEKQ
jgi:hypothetical protein